MSLSKATQRSFESFYVTSLADWPARWLCRWRGISQEHHEQVTCADTFVSYADWRCTSGRCGNSIVSAISGVIPSCQLCLMLNKLLLVDKGSVAALSRHRRVQLLAANTTFRLRATRRAFCFRLTAWLEGPA